MREIATEPLAVWSLSEELLALTVDPSGSVRKAAMYRLELVPRGDRSLAEIAWDHMLDGAGFIASEALRTYVAHADGDITECCGPRLSQFIGRRLPMLAGHA